MKSVTCKMDPVIKVKWLAALRSDKYGQTTGKLYETERSQGGDGYCCLGVLAKVQGEPIETQWYIDTLEKSHLDEHLAAGLSMDVMKRLAAMNDGSVFNGHPFRRSTFNQIAAYIERYL